jgi:alpha-1,6-mannosyltransferase
VYGGIVWLSRFFVYGEGHVQRPILLFLGLYAAAFVLYWLAVRALPDLQRQQRETPLLFIIVGSAVLSRAVLLFSQPIQEDDFYRYLWDGQIVASGLNPYSVAPGTVLKPGEKNDEVERRAAIVTQDANFALILSRVNHPAVPTIYPPLAQGIFGLSAIIAPGSLSTLRLFFLAFDLGICGLLWLILQRLDASPLWVLVYAWSPLVIKESINSAHYDVAPTFFLVLALLLCLRNYLVGAYVSLALAILGKLYPVILLPLFLRRTWETGSLRHAIGGGTITVVVVACGYAPFVDAGTMLWQGTLTFAQYWRTNTLLFPGLQMLVGERWLANAVVVGLLGCTVLGVLARFSLRDSRAFLWGNFVVLGMLFLLSPVGNPWYFVWIVPFLCVFPLQSGVMFSGLLGLYYLAFYFIYRDSAETFRWVVWLEYILFYGMLLYEWYVGKLHFRRQVRSMTG